MSGNDVEIGVGVRNADQHREFLRLKEEIVGLRGELERTAKAGAASNRSLNDGLRDATLAGGQLLGRLTGVGSVIGGILTFAQLLKQEYQQFIQTQKDAAKGQVGVNAAFARASVAARGGIAPTDLYERVIGGAKGVNPAELFAAFEGAAGGSQKVSMEDKLRATLASAELANQYDAGTRTALVSSAVASQGTFGGTPEQNIAAHIQAFQASGAKSFDEYAQTLAPAISKAAKPGKGKDSFEFLASQLIEYSRAVGSSELGASSFPSVQKQVMEAAMKSGKSAVGDSFESMLEVVRSDPEIQKKLLGRIAAEAGGERELRKSKDDGTLNAKGAAYFGAVEFLSGRGGGTQVGGINDATLAKVTEENRRIEGNKYSVAAKLDQFGKQLETSTQLGNANLGNVGGLLDFQAKALKTMGQNSAARSVEEYASSFDIQQSGGDPGAAQQIVLSKLGRIARRKLGVSSDSDMARGPEIGAGFDPFDFPQDKEGAVKVLGALEEIAAYLKEANQQRERPAKVEVQGRTNQPAAPAAGRLND